MRTITKGYLGCINGTFFSFGRHKDSTRSVSAYRIRLKKWRPMLNKEVLISTQPKPNAPTPIAVDANPLKFVDYRPVIYVDHWTDRPYVYYYFYYC